MFIQVQSLLQSRMYSLCTISLLSLLTLRSTFFVRAFHSSQIFQPMIESFPEVNRALQNSHNIDQVLQELKTQYNPLAHLNDRDKDQQLTNFHMPVYQYVKALLHRHRTVHDTKPIFIGISAPQGCGKTTLTNIICDLFRIEGKTCIAMSLDDFYLTGEQQEQLAKNYPHNKLLEFRGNAGSHDLHLAMTTLHTLLNPSGGDSEVRIPVYDKALREGRGDRLPQESWITITGRVDVVLFEGWMFGFTPLGDVPMPAAEWTNSVDKVESSGAVDASTEATTDVAGAVEGISEQVDKQKVQQLRAEYELAFSKAKSIKEVNELLRPYEALNMCMDAWLVLAVEDSSVVYKWRLQAEQQMRAAGRGGMTDDQVADFVDRYMPAYETYLGDLYARGPQRSHIRPELSHPPPQPPMQVAAAAQLSPVLKINVGSDRLPISSEMLK